MKAKHIVSLTFATAALATYVAGNTVAPPSSKEEAEAGDLAIQALLTISTASQLTKEKQI